MKVTKNTTHNRLRVISSAPNITGPIYALSDVWSTSPLISCSVFFWRWV